MPSLRRPMSALAVAALLCLVGCGVEVVPDPTGSPSGSGQTPATSSAGPSTPTPVAPADVAGRGSYEGWASEIREGRQREVRCDGEPVTLDTPSLTVELTGRCGTVTVSGVGSSVLAEDIGSLVVTGNQVLVATRSVDEVSVSGDGVEVYWVEGDPGIAGTRTDTVAARIPARP